MEPAVRQPEPAHNGNGLALASLLLAVFGLSTPALITGVISLVENRPGRGMAYAGLALVAVRYVLAMLVLLVVAAALFVFALGAALNDSRHESGGCRWLNRCWSRIETSLNVDTTWHAQAGRFADSLEQQADEIEQQADSLSELPSAADEPLAIARNQLGQVRDLIAELRAARDEKTILDLHDRAARHLAAARTSLAPFEEGEP